MANGALGSLWREREDRQRTSRGEVRRGIAGRSRMEVVVEEEEVKDEEMVLLVYVDHSFWW